MPLATNTAFDSFAARSGRPLYVLHLPDLNTYLANDYVQGLPSALLLLEDFPAAVPTQVNLLRGRSSHAGLQLEATDTADQYSALLASGMTQRDGVLYKLFEGMHWDARVQLFRGRVATSVLGSTGTTWKITLANRLDELNVLILRPEDIAGEYLAGGSTSRAWSGTDANGDVFTLTAYDTDADGVLDQVVLQGNPFNLALALMLGGNPAAGASPYNAFPAWAGAGLDVAMVDVTQWETARNTWSLLQCKYTYNDAIRVLDWVQDEVMRLVVGHTPVSPDGKIGAVVPQVPNPVAGLTVVTDGDVQAQPILVDDDGALVTHVYFEFDHDGSSYGTVLPAYTSQQYLTGRFKVERPHKIASRGLQTDLGAYSVIRVVLSVLFRRFGESPRRLAFTLPPDHDTLQAGDRIEIQSEAVPNADVPVPLATGASRYLELIRVQPRPLDVAVEGLLLPPALPSGEVAGVIALSGAPDYTAASVEQRKYAYLADPTTNDMSNGDNGYAWG